jgi:hypothetical protein
VHVAPQADRLQNMQTTPMGDLVLRFGAIAAWSLALLSVTCYVGKNGESCVRKRAGAAPCLVVM